MEIIYNCKKLLIEKDEKIANLEGKYNELLSAVYSKYPDETCHETALRYIKRVEMPRREMSADEIAREYNEILKLKDEIVRLKSVPHVDIEKIINKILDDMLKNNPYPETVFIEPTEKQYKKFHEVLKQKDLCGSAFFGSWGRHLYKVIIQKLREEFVDILEDFSL